MLPSKKKVVINGSVRVGTWKKVVSIIKHYGKQIVQKNEKSKFHHQVAINQFFPISSAMYIKIFWTEWEKYGFPLCQKHLEDSGEKSIRILTITPNSICVPIFLPSFTSKNKVFPEYKIICYTKATSWIEFLQLKNVTLTWLYCLNIKFVQLVFSIL